MKMYVIARRDLSPAQQAVQSCHAVAELCLRHRDDPALIEWAENHKTMVLLGVDDEEDLSKWQNKLEDSGIPCSVFTEPDIGDQKTALALHPSCNSALVKRLRLL